MSDKVHVIKKRGHIIVLSFLLHINIVCQNNNFSSVLHLKQQHKIIGLSNNPYKLITECFFNKSADGNIVWGSTKIHSGYYFNVLDIKKNELQKVNINIEKLNTGITKRDYDDLIYYGFSTVVQTKAYSIFDVGNNLYIFNENDDELTFHKQIHVPDSIEFNYIFSNTDSSLILLDYRASFDSSKKIKAYQLQLYSNKINCFFEADMSSNSACYDKANTKFFDANNKYFLITDNLEYKIYLFDKHTKKIATYYKPLAISDSSMKMLNPDGIKEHTLNSISKELEKVPRIINTQFINDSNIIVNYSIKPSIEKHGGKIKNSVVDILSIRDNSIRFKSTYDDSFYYEQINYAKTKKINPSEINPYIRSEFYHFTQNNHLIKVTYQQLVPKSNTSFEKYIRKAKYSIFNLKSSLIYNLYEFRL